MEDISGTSVCPLARSVRKQLRAAGVKKGVTVVYSKEPVQRAEAGEVPGSMVFVPASAGLLMASYIVRQILQKIANRPLERYFYQILEVDDG